MNPVANSLAKLNGMEAKGRFWNVLINGRSRGGSHAKMSRRAGTVALFPIKGDLPFVYYD